MDFWATEFFQIQKTAMDRNARPTKQHVAPKDRDPNEWPMLLNRMTPDHGIAHGQDLNTSGV